MGSEDKHLFDAAQLGNLLSVQHLLKWGADPNWRNPDAGGETALHAAVFFGESDIVRALVAAGASVTAKDQDGRTPLHAAAMRRLEQVATNTALGVEVQELQRDETSRSIVRALLDAGADVWAKDRAGESALHLAAHSGRLEVLDALLKAGADPKARNQAGKTALQIATRAEIRRELLRYDPPSKERQLFEAAMAGDLALVQALLRAGAEFNWQNPDQDLETPLHAAAFFGELDIVRALIAAGARIMARNQDGKTPLHAAAMKSDHDMAAGGSLQSLPEAQQRRVDVARALLAAGADVWAKDKAGNTALHLAASSGRVGMVQVLLKAGGEVEARNADGQTALDVASTFAVKETIKFAFVGRAQASSAAADKDEEPQCIVCMGAPRQYIMVPCGHCLYCKECAAAVAAQGACALCRQPVEKYLRVYMD